MKTADTTTAGLGDVLADAELAQKEFAELGDWLPSTVNRWVRQRETDGRPVPRYAMALALAYRMLPKTKRAELKAELAAIDAAAQS